MQHLENDMDELFRKAAENYPLKTGADKWEDIAPFVQTIPTAAAPAGKNKSVRAVVLPVPIMLTLFLLFLLYQKHHDYTLKENNGLANHESLAKTTTVNYKRSVLKEDIIKKESMTTGLQSRQHMAISRNVQGSTLYTSDKKSSIILDGKDAGNATPMQGSYLQIGTVKRVPAIRNAFILIKPVENKEELINKTTINAVLPEVPAKNLVKNKNTGFYFGLQAGLQLNQVQGQGFTKAGLVQE